MWLDETRDSNALCFTMKMVHVRPKVATSLRKTEHAIQIAWEMVRARPKVAIHFVKRNTRFKCILFYKEMVRARPKVATLLRKTEHAIQIHCVLH